MTTRTRFWAIAIGGLLLIFAFLGGTKVLQIMTMISAGKKMVPPPESVSTTKVEIQPWRSVESAVGTLVAIRGVTLGAELAGLVREITFESGSTVHKGAPLVRLDTSTEEAQLDAARADETLAKLSLARTRELRKGGSATPADSDAAEAKEKSAAAQVGLLEATIAKKTIRAPFDGRISIRTVELGQILSSGATIASLQTVTPIHAEFWLPQQALAALLVGQKAEVRVDIYPGQVWVGAVTTVNPEVDPATRNVRVRATVENPDGRLRPGMFASVTVFTGEPKDTVVVPETSVLYAPFGDSVYVIEKKSENGKDELVAKQRFVRLGERRGDFVSINSGLTSGETIVSSGAFKLRNGSAVAVNNDLAPHAELSPKPVDR